GYAELAFVGSTTRSVSVLPGLSSFVLRPEMLKSWDSAPLFVTLKITVPSFTVLGESVKWNSVGLPAVTVTVAMCAVAVLAAFVECAPAGSAHTSTALSAASARNRIRNLVMQLTPLGWKSE